VFTAGRNNGTSLKVRKGIVDPYREYRPDQLGREERVMKVKSAKKSKRPSLFSATIPGFGSLVDLSGSR